MTNAKLSAIIPTRSTAILAVSRIMGILPMRFVGWALAHLFFILLPHPAGAKNEEKIRPNSTFKITN